MATAKESKLKWSCKCRKKAPQTQPKSDKVNNIIVFHECLMYRECMYF